jgi:NAD kinase
MRVSDRRLIIIRRKTRLEDLIYKYGTVGQAEFYMANMGESALFSDCVNEDKHFRIGLDLLMRTLTSYGRVQILERDFVPNFIFSESDIVIAFGQDGLCANILKYLNFQPLIGVNPDNKRFDGKLLPFTPQNADKAIESVIAGKFRYDEVTIAQAVTSDGQELRAVNDFFIGQKTHISARYRVKWGDIAENQSSSGIIVSTGLGSTGWLKSYFAMLGNRGTAEFPRTDEKLKFFIREPFPSNTTGATILSGDIDAKTRFEVTSQMPEGVIFSDGVESDFIEFKSGIGVKIKIDDKKGILAI